MDGCVEQVKHYIDLVRKYHNNGLSLCNFSAIYDMIYSSSGEKLMKQQEGNYAIIFKKKLQNQKKLQMAKL